MFTRLKEGTKLTDKTGFPNYSQSMCDKDEENKYCMFQMKAEVALSLLMQNFRENHKNVKLGRQSNQFL